MEYELRIQSPRPFFAEIPYYLWGAVNYDSEGDCERPTDREWKALDLTHRVTHETLEIRGNGENWKVIGEDPLAARAAMFLAARCSSGAVSPSPVGRVGQWLHEEGLARAKRVAEEFSSPKLRIFDSHLFWGSWKWIGWFASDFAWMGRMIMLSVLKGDPRGVPLCIEWLDRGTCCAEQSKVLREALHALTGESFDTHEACFRWYYTNSPKPAPQDKYPEADMDAWLVELKKEYGA
jgi:hypothetical protein